MKNVIMLLRYKYYSKTMNIRTEIFGNTCKFEINLGHTGFREKDLFMI